MLHSLIFKTSMHGEIKCDSLPVAGMLYHMATSAVEILLSAAGLHSPVIGGVVGSP